MALISPYLKLTKLEDNSLYAEAFAAHLPVAQIDRVLDNPAHLHLELPLLSTPALAIVNATGGPSLTGAIVALFGEFSLDGGATYDIRFILVSAKRVMDPNGPLLIIDQYDQSTVYGVSGADRVTFIGTDSRGGVLNTADTAFNALPGTVARPSGSIGLAAVPAWPNTKGLFQIKPGASSWAGQDRLAMSAYIDPQLRPLPLSLDVNALSTQSVLKSVGQRLAGVWDPNDTAPPGSRAHWVSHSGDRAPDGILPRSIAIGRVGRPSAPKLTFDADTAGTWDETTTIRFTGTGLAHDPRLEELFAQISTIGGSSDHGIAADTTITCALCINTNRAYTTTGWDDNLPIFGTTAGVYYHVPGSGFLVPMSPVFVVNAIAYDNAGQRLYVATPTGVFTAPSQPPNFGTGAVAVWTRVGGLSAPVEDLWLVPGGILLVRCGGSTKKNGVGVDGVYQYPAISGDTSGDTQGYAGYSRIAHSGSPIAAGGTPTALYYTDSSKPGTVYLLSPGTTTAPVKVTGIPPGQSVLGIDTVITTLPDHTLSQVVFVRTDGGAAAGLFSLTVGATSALNANDGTLKSNDNTPVQVRRIVASGVTVWDEFINAWAATDAGLFRTAQPAGGSWSAPNASSGLGDFDISFVAAGVVQTVLGERVHRIWAGSGKSILSSADAGDSWSDILAAKLDKGPAWYARAQAWGARPWPDNNLGALGTLPSYGLGHALGSTGTILGGPSPGLGNLSPGGGTDTGGTGNVLSCPAGGKGRLPTGFLRARRLNEQKQFTFRTVLLGSQAPQQGMQWSELSEITASANVGVIAAAEQLDLVEFRWLSAASVPRWQLPLAGSITQTNAAGRDLCPTDCVALRYNPVGFTAAMALNLTAYVISHSIIVSGGLARTNTLVSNSLESGALDANAMAVAGAERLSKAIRWG